MVIAPRSPVVGPWVRNLFSRAHIDFDLLRPRLSTFCEMSENGSCINMCGCQVLTSGSTDRLKIT